MTKNVFLEIISWSISKSIGPNYIPSCTPIFFFKAVCSNQRDFLINFISLTKGWKSIVYLMYLVDGVTAVYYFSMSNFWGFVNIINVTMSNLNWNSLSLTNCSTNTKSFLKSCEVATLLKLTITKFIVSQVSAESCHQGFIFILQSNDWWKVLDNFVKP